MVRNNQELPKKLKLMPACFALPIKKFPNFIKNKIKNPEKISFIYLFRSVCLARFLKKNTIEEREN